LAVDGGFGRVELKELVSGFLQKDLMATEVTPHRAAETKAMRMKDGDCRAT
jgi:hypothetical protein